MTDVRGWVTAAVVFAGAFLLWSVIAGALSALLLLFTAVLLSAGLRPLVDRMSRRLPFGAAVGIAFGGLIVVTVVLGVVLLQPVGAELVKLVQAMPGFVDALQQQFTAAQRFLESDQTARQIAQALAGSAGGLMTGLSQNVLGGPKIVAECIGNVLLILLLAVGWMLSSDELERFVLSLMPNSSRELWSSAFSDINARLSAYVQGVVLNGAVVGAAIGIALAILGVPYGLLLAFVAAIFQAIPMVGAVISGPIILLVVLATSGWEKMLIALAIFVVVQILDQNMLSPIIFGQRVQLSFLLIILATIVGGTLLGISGAFLAVPAAASLQVLVTRVAAPAVRKASGAPRP